MLILVPSFAYAQLPQAGPNSNLAWDQDAPDLATAQGYAYKYYYDGTSTGSAFMTAVTCTGVAPTFQCQAKIPTTTNGAHNIQATATNIVGESNKSNPFAFGFVVNPPSAPRNLHIVELFRKLFRGTINAFKH